MTEALTKDCLAALQTHRGQLETDSGQVFVKPVGRIHEDGLYHVKLHFTSYDPETFDASKGTFSLSKLTEE